MNGPHTPETGPLPRSAAIGQADIAPFKTLLLAACGFGFERERESVLVDALGRRMAATKAVSLDAYRSLLAASADEMVRLVELLTVNETYFLREPEALRLVTDRIVPELLAARPGGTVRLLSAGCSTGEEPYSLAILLRERFGPGWENLCRVAGVDIDASVLAAARRAVYGKGSFRGMDQDLVRRHFSPSPEGGWRLDPDICGAVRLEPANLLTGGCLSLMRDQDVILYRNVSIYFPPEVQKAVFHRLADCLVPGGYLLVGATETLHHDLGLLTLVERDGLFLYRKSEGCPSRDRTGRLADPVGPASQAVAARKCRLQSAPAEPKKRSGAPLSRSRPAAVDGPASRPANPHGLDKEDLLTKALNLGRQQRAGEALALVEQALAEDSTCVRGQVLKASLLIGLDRTVEARQACRLALGRDPLCLEAKLMLGIVALVGNDSEQALACLREAICIDPGCWLAHFHTAEIMFSRDERKRARGGYETALRLLTDAPAGAGAARPFPLNFNADQFMAICRHKLALLKRNG